MLLSVSYAIAAYFIVNAQFAPGNDVVYIWKRPVLGRETAARDSYDNSDRWQFHFKGGYRTRVPYKPFQRPRKALLGGVLEWAFRGIEGRKWAFFSLKQLFFNRSIN